MGTNFYARRLPTNLQTEEIIERVLDFASGKMHSSDFLQGIENIEEVHLGKRSCGWQFLWQTSCHYFACLSSIMEYLSSPGVIIYNEYGDTFTLKQFIEEEVGESLYNDPENYINGSQYHKKHPNEPFYRPGAEWTSEDGLRFTEDDFS